MAKGRSFIIRNLCVFLAISSGIVSLDAQIAPISGLGASPSSAAGTPRPALLGTIHDDHNLPVDDAVISIAKKLPVGPAGFAGHATGAVVATTGTDKQGRFAVPTLPDGDYVACASTKRPGVLSNCVWRGAVDTFSVVNGSAPRLDLKLATGSRLFVRLHDPGGHLAKAASGRQPDVVALIVQTDGMKVPLSVNSSDEKGRVLEVAIPWDTDVRLSVNSPSLSLGNSQGKAAEAAGLSIPVRHTAQDTSTTRPVTVPVLGKR